MTKMPNAKTTARERPEEASAVAVCLLWRHPLVATEFRARLEGQPFLVADERLATAGETPTVSRDVQVVVVESGDRSALPVLVQLDRICPWARTIVLAEDFDDEADAFRLLRGGAKGLVTYPEMATRLAGALEAVAAGGFWVPRVLLSRFVESTVRSSPWLRPQATTSLTPREAEILEDLLQNLSNKEIAKRRHLTSRTVKFHVSNVLAKYRVKRRADLLLLSYSTH